MRVRHIQQFISQEHASCNYRHHFTGDFYQTCSSEIIARTLCCGHKTDPINPNGIASIHDAIDELFNSVLIDSNQRDILKAFTQEIVSSNKIRDLAAVSASLHLRKNSWIADTHLYNLGLSSVDELDQLSLTELENLVGQQQVEANRGLVALKMTVMNVANDLQFSNLHKAKERMKRFTDRWTKSHALS
ncbi:MAG: hypothetical protein HOA17_06360 [Candidatus Melainabacteria bacterium]|nr:hypothetical protein [Candidatus Melainabacteria bacterium]